MFKDHNLKFYFFSADLSAGEMVSQFTIDFENHGFKDISEEEFLKDINLKNFEA